MRTFSCLLLLTLALLAVFACRSGAPAIPRVVAAPDTTWAHAPTPVRVFTTAPAGKPVRYVADLGNQSQDTSGVFAAGETTQLALRWPASGWYKFRVKAMLAENPALASAFSDDVGISVLANSPPVLHHILSPMVAVRGVPFALTLEAEDPDGDSVQFFVDWGDGTSGWLDTILPSPAVLHAGHEYGEVGTVRLVCLARDLRGAESGPETATVSIRTSGALLAFFTPWEPARTLGTAPVVVEWLNSTLIYIGGCEDGYFYSITYAGTPKMVRRGTSVASGCIFSGHPAYCAQTGHIVVGNEDGEFYAFNTGLGGADWRYPGTHPDSLTWIEWGTPAIKGNKLYVPRADSRLYCLQDNGSSVSLVGSYSFPATLSAPIIDGNGNVYVGSDSGVLYCLPPSIGTITWSRQLQVGELRGLCMDDVGTLYLTSEFGNIYAINKDNGDIKWQVTPDPGRETHSIVISPTALFVTTSSGRLYKLNPTTGVTIWQKQVSPSDMPACPVLAGTDYIYCLDDDDILYCVQQSDGALVWACNCPQQAGIGRQVRSTLKSSPFGAALTLVPDGNIIVGGEEAMYVVAGYPEHLLPTSAPWPKWQRDLHNTGSR